MALLEFTPENEVERLIAEARRGRKTMADLVAALAGGEIVAGSRAPVQPDGRGFEPILLEGPDGPLVAVFTSFSRLVLHVRLAEHVLQMKGRNFFLALPPGFGVVINPGYAAQMIMPASGVADLQADLKVTAKA